MKHELLSLILIDKLELQYCTLIIGRTRTRFAINVEFEKNRGKIKMRKLKALSI